MMGRFRHLHDDRLYECYFADRDGEPIDPRAAEHLADCPACAARYADIVEFLADLRRGAEHDADEVFTARRLEAQQDGILRRIEHVSRPSRIISFPGRITQDARGGPTRVAPRWLAAAAAAGLLVGGAVGGLFSQPRITRGNTAARGANTASSVPRIPPPAVRVNAPAQTVEVLDDDRFLLELEVALERPHTRELMPFDNLTPHIQEIGSRVR